MKQEKTIEDYRRDIKLLKLKYIKLQEEKLKLEQTVSKLAVNSSGRTYDYQDADAGRPALSDPPKSGSNYMSYDKNVMKEFSNRCKTVLGMSPESLYRAADVEGSGKVTDQQLKTFLQQSKLNLSAQYIQRILQLADVSCTGIIKRDQFYECLAAFQINQEVSSTPTLASGNRTYVQKSLAKFAANLISLKISPHDCFSQMDASSENYIGYDDLNSFVAKYCKDMNDTECIGSFNYLDIDKEQRISRDTFVVEVKKIMRIIAKEKGSDINDFIDSRSNRPNNNKPPIPFNRSNSGSRQQQNDSNPAEEITGETVPVNLKGLDEKEVNDIMQKITQVYKIDLQGFFDAIVNNSSHPTAGIFISDFIGIFDKLKIGRKVPNELKLKFFRCIDSGNNGSIDYEEMLRFYVERKIEQNPIDLAYLIVARILHSIGVRTEQALTFINIEKEKMLDENEFKIVADKVFYITKPDQVKKLFKELTNNSGRLNAEQLITEIDKQIDFLTEEDALNNSSLRKSSTGTGRRKSSSEKDKGSSKDIKNSSLNDSQGKIGSMVRLGTKAMSLVETNIGEYERIMEEIYPDFNTEKDFFPRIDKKDDGTVVMTYWKTIMNDELPTLKMVLEFVKDLKEGEKWNDPEFGPMESDPFGSQSMYFSDNDIPSGCPPPENVSWMHIQDQLNYFMENNSEEISDQLQGGVAEFMQSGASANDVKQSSYLGDCWFVSALSILAQKDYYLIGSFDPNNKDISEEQFFLSMSEGVYPPMFHFLSKYGIFIFKFYKNFEWRYVIIDDKIPCLDGKIIYSHCRTPNEYWVSLIEKAYAKLHNCYQALTSGDIGQGLTDLTGQVSMKIRFEHLRITRSQIESGEFDKSGIIINGVKKAVSEDNYDEVIEILQQEKDRFWKSITRYFKEGTLMGCSADGGTESGITYNDEKAGIYSGHAYSILNIFTLDYNRDEKEKHEGNVHQNHRLLCLRNPWGFGEWLLKWSETEETDDRKLDKNIDSVNKYFDDAIANALSNKTEAPEKYKPGTDDGMFLMCYKDWRNIYSNLFACFSFNPKEWVGYEIEDQWTKGFCSGTVKKGEPSITNFAQKNPQFTFQLKKQQQSKVYTFINLVQADGRLYDGAKYPYENVQQSLLLCLFVLEPGKTKLEKFDPKLMICSSGKFNLRREVDFGKLIEIEVGKTYCLVPCTLKGEEAFDDFKPINFSINFYFNNCPVKDVDFQRVNGEGKFKKDMVNVSAVDPTLAQNTAKLKQFLKSNIQMAMYD